MICAPLGAADFGTRFQAQRELSQKHAPPPPAQSVRTTRPTTRASAPPPPPDAALSVLDKVLPGPPTPAPKDNTMLFVLVGAFLLMGDKR